MRNSIPPSTHDDPSAIVKDTSRSNLISPYGESLVDLLVNNSRKQEWIRQIPEMEEIQLSQTNLCDLELLSCGGFSPLHTFLSKEDYESVVERMRLSDGTLWPIPITLAVRNPDPYKIGAPVALRDVKHGTLAVMKLEEIYEVNVQKEAELVFGGDPEHPAVRELLKEGKFRISGPVEVLGLPQHRDFMAFRHTPVALRAAMNARGWARVVAFQTRNPLHRAHEELTKRAAKDLNAQILIHAVVGKTKPGDVNHFARVRCYQTLIEHYYSPDDTLLSLLPLAMRMAGPREALWHAIIRRNYGASHFIVGRDHAGPGKNSKGNPFYPPFRAQELVAEHEQEIGIKMVPFQDIVYVPQQDSYMPANQVPQGSIIASLSGTEVREGYLAKGRRLPDWFTRPEVADVLHHTYPPKHRQGLTLWLTGLSGAGKTTISELLAERLLEFGREATLLDGDVVREHLSKGLGFSKEDRDTNIRRIGFVACEISRHGGTVICAAISPYEKIRHEVRHTIENFVEVYVNAPVDVCERRDVKGLYQRAKAGLIKGFTGIDDPYEPPEAPEIECCTDQETVEESVDRILKKLMELGHIRHGT